jgi:hypothetical protein
LKGKERGGGGMRTRGVAKLPIGKRMNFLLRDSKDKKRKNKRIIK